MITFLAFAHMLDATQLVWGGWGGMITLLALAHMLDATQLVWGGWGGDDNIPCTCTHVGCYATGLGWVGGGMITWLALAHMLDATQHMLDATQLVWGWWGGMIAFLPFPLRKLWFSAMAIEDGSQSAKRSVCNTGMWFIS